MKKFVFMTILTLSVVFFLLNFHVVRLDDGVEIISKEHLSLRDTFVDVRNWGLVDFASHSPRIWTYLIFEKKYPEVRKQLTENSNTTVHEVKSKIRSIIDIGYNWISEKLR